jgi:hypothetical protein
MDSFNHSSLFQDTIIQLRWITISLQLEKELINHQLDNITSQDSLEDDTDIVGVQEPKKRKWCRETWENFYQKYSKLLAMRSL